MMILAMLLAILLLMLPYLTSMLEICMLVYEIVMIIWKLIRKLPNYSTIQKPYCRLFLELYLASFADALRSEKVFGAHFKRWQVKVTNWLTAMKVFWVSTGMPDANISEEDLRRF